VERYCSKRVTRRALTLLKKPSGSTRLVPSHQPAIVGIDPKFDREIIKQKHL